MYGVRSETFSVGSGIQPDRQFQLSALGSRPSGDAYRLGTGYTFSVHLCDHRDNPSHLDRHRRL